MMDEAASPEPSSFAAARKRNGNRLGTEPRRNEEGSPGPTCTYPSLEAAQSLPTQCWEGRPSRSRPQ